MVVTVNYRSQVTAVVPQGFEPRLLASKMPRVASYTIGQFAGHRLTCGADIITHL